MPAEAGGRRDTTKRKKRHTRAPNLTREQLERAIFLDYEGNSAAPGSQDHPPPTLLGYLVDNKLGAGIVEPLFAKHCSGRYRATHAIAADHVELVMALLEWAETESRVIVSWSEHDLKVMTRAVPELEERLKAVHRNAIKPARKYLRGLGIAPTRGSTTLYGVCDLLRVPVIEKFGAGHVGEGLRLIRSQLKEGRTYAELTPAARKSWQVIVKHNKQDLLTMREVLQQVVPNPARQD
ncbi:hypothetical protein [Thioalkalivibrio sp. XN279]|uniref:hypothetical protein n=1 Tax=Thioalkalivibrio sp. XN279 TaxID=2714953 RepID=UPI0014090604|nr:hypothetical protein [Thioalkalivibrio sp. XN279]NHA14157.1 hypothetical protein [Thioalkalivibrio sp. XN279]